MRALMGLAVGWLVLAGLLLLELWPAMPESRREWALFIVFGPPVYLFGEYISEKFFSPKVGYGIAPPGFSFKRVLVALFFVLVLLAAGAAALWLKAKG